MTSLKDKTISNVFWSMVQKMGSKGILFVATIVLARLLTPEQFGLIGMLSIFIQLSYLLVTGGLDQALIQKKETDNEDYSSAFWINLAVSILLYIALFFAAPFIADFYQQPILTNLTRVLSLVFVINAFSVVQEARLMKQMQFKKLAIIYIPAAVVAGAVSVVMAVYHYGVWSIVALQLVFRLCYSIQIWFYAQWKPQFSINKQKVFRLFSYGGKLMVSIILNAIYRNIYLVVIGRFYPLSYVGYYKNAFDFVQYPTITFSGAVRAVVFSTFSTIQDEDQQLKKGQRKLNQQVLFWVCPAFILAAALAVPLFRFIFTEKWLPAVPYFRFLCIFGIIYPLLLYGRNLVDAKGKAGLNLKLTVAEKVITTIGIVIAIPFSIWAVLIVQVAGIFIAYLLFGYFVGRLIHYPLWEQLKDINSIVILSVVVGGIVFGLDQLWIELPDVLRLLIGFSIGGGLYYLGARYSQMDVYTDARRLFKDNLITYFK